MKEKARLRRTAGAARTPDARTLARELAALKLKLRVQTRELRQSVSEAEEARGLSAKLYTTMLENSGIGMGYYTMDGVLLYFNQAAVKEIGGTPHDYVGKSIGEIFGTPDSEEWKRRTRAAAGQDLSGYEDHILLPNGGRWFLSSYALVRDAAGAAIGVQIVSQDITEGKEAEEAFRESESRFRTLIENAPVAIDISRQGEAVYRNRTYARLFGFEDAGKLVGRSISDQIAPRCRKEVMERALRRSRGLPEETQFESVGLRRDGTEFPFKAAVTVLDLADGPATVSFITDITSQKDFEQKLGDSHLKLRNLASHLLSAREAERTSVAREIHDELGQLLTAFKMDLRWIEKRLKAADGGILEKIRSTSVLADQAIDIVRRIASDLRPVMLDDLGLPAAIEWLGGEFSKRTRIKCDTEVTLHESRIGGDSATALFRIVQECLNNVSRHSRASHVSILLWEKDDRLEIKVEDDGIGITSEQAAASSSFGLIGMRERVEGLGGQLVVQGRKGKGTKVTATVPLPSGGGLA